MPDRPAGPAPDASSLREWALAYLARFATTEAGLLRALHRRIARWAQAAESVPDAVIKAHAAREQAGEVVRALARSGAIDDRLFAEARSRTLARAGRSRRAMAAHLRAKGVDPALVADSLPPEEQELAQALAYAKRRRLGPFRSGETESPEQRLRALAALARAGFPQGVAVQALGVDPDSAEALVLSLRRS